jgi:hypothetical protein
MLTFLVYLVVTVSPRPTIPEGISMQVTISQAAKMAGVSRATIYNDIESGTLSVENGPKDRKMVNVSELERVYKTLKNPEPEEDSNSEQISQSRQKEKSNSADQVAVLQERLEAQRKQTQLLENMLEKEQEERKREREATKEFQEYFKTQIENQAESIKNFTRLLEDHRNQEEKGAGGKWEKSFKDMEERIANQDAQARKEIEEIKKNSQRQVLQYKTALEVEKNKPLWKRLFG